jgi:hypothetical protein
MRVTDDEIWWACGRPGSRERIDWWPTLGAAPVRLAAVLRHYGRARRPDHSPRRSGLTDDLSPSRADVQKDVVCMSGTATAVTCDEIIAPFRATTAIWNRIARKPRVAGRAVHAGADVEHKIDQFLANRTDLTPAQRDIARAVAAYAWGSVVGYVHTLDERDTSVETDDAVAAGLAALVHLWQSEEQDRDYDNIRRPD